MTQSENSLRNWLALTHIPNCGPVRIHSLLEIFDNPSSLRIIYSCVLRILFSTHPKTPTICPIFLKFKMREGSAKNIRVIRLNEVHSQ